MQFHRNDKVPLYEIGLAFVCTHPSEALRGKFGHALWLPYQCTN